MKNLLLKSLILVALLLTFALKASCPQVPATTLVRISYIEPGTYAALICCHGYERDTYDEYSDYITVTNPSSTLQTFTADHAFVHNSNLGIFMSVSVWIKPTSNSNWIPKGTAWSHDSWVTSEVDNYFLWRMSFNYGSLPVPD